jgi:hypothetical protein
MAMHNVRDIGSLQWHATIGMGRVVYVRSRVRVLAQSYTKSFRLEEVERDPQEA